MPLGQQARPALFLVSMGQCLWKSRNEKSHVYQTGDDLYPDGPEKDLQDFVRLGRALYGPAWGLRVARLRFREEDEEIKSKINEKLTNEETHVY